jgi:hypothetical protein
MKTMGIQLLCILMSATAMLGQGLITAGDIFDGTPRDIAAGNGVLYLVQGRHHDLLDSETSLRTANYTSLPYSEQLTAIELIADYPAFRNPATQYSSLDASVSYVINAENVTGNQPAHSLKQWWISSSDGGISVIHLSQSNSNPPQVFTQKPAQWRNDIVYQNDIVVNDWNNDGFPDDVASQVVNDDGNHLCIAHRPGVVQHNQFNSGSREVSGPLDVLAGNNFSVTTSPGGSYFAPLSRVHFPGEDGTILEIDNFVTKDLIAHWTFDNDIDTNVLDKSGNEFHGTAHNILYEDGPVSRAAVFNGTTSRIDFPVMSAIPPTEIGNLNYGSISLWFKFQNMGGDILPLLYFGENDASLPHNSLIIEIGHSQDIEDKRLYFTILVAPYNLTRFCFDNGFNLQENTWYHFVAVVGYEGNTGYLNGVELSERRYNLNSNASYTDFFAQVTARKQLSFGYGRYGRNPSFFHFKGSLDDVRIYGKALTAAEVQTLFSLGNTTGIANYTFQSENNLIIANYPNPFNTNTTIRWQSSISGQTTIAVFDMLGRKVKTLVDEFKQQGEYTVHFDSDELPAGTFFYQLKVGNHRATNKMIKTK